MNLFDSDITLDQEDEKPKKDFVSRAIKLDITPNPESPEERQALNTEDNGVAMNSLTGLPERLPEKNFDTRDTTLAGGMLPNGAVSTAMNQYLQSDEAAAKGYITPEAKGFASSFLAGFLTDSASMAKSVNYAFTGKSTDRFDSILKDPALGRPTGGKWWREELGYLAGSAAPTSAVIMGGAALAAIPATSAAGLTLLSALGGFAGAFIRNYGQKLEEIDSLAGGKLDPYEKVFEALWESSAEAAVEAIPFGGGEVNIVRRLAKARSLKAALNRVPRKGVSAMVRGLQRSPISAGAKAWAINVLREGVENPVQMLSSEITRNYLLDTPMSSPGEYVQSAVDGGLGSFLMAIGSVHSAVSQQRFFNKATRFLNTDEKLLHHTKFQAALPGVGSDAASQLQAADTMFNELRTVLVQRFGEDAGSGLAEIMRNVAYSSGEDSKKSAIEYINKFRMAFINQPLTPEQESEIKRLQSLPDPKRANSELFKYLDKQFGLSSMINDVEQNTKRIMLEKLVEQVQQLEQEGFEVASNPAVLEWLTNHVGNIVRTPEEQAEVDKSRVERKKAEAGTRVPLAQQEQQARKKAESAQWEMAAHPAILEWIGSQPAGAEAVTAAHSKMSEVEMKSLANAVADAEGVKKANTKERGRILEAIKKNDPDAMRSVEKLQQIEEQNKQEAERKNLEDVRLNGLVVGEAPGERSVRNALRKGVWVQSGLAVVDHLGNVRVLSPEHPAVQGRLAPFIADEFRRVLSKSKPGTVTPPSISAEAIPTSASSYVKKTAAEMARKVLSGERTIEDIDRVLRQAGHAEAMSNIRRGVLGEALEIFINGKSMTDTFPALGLTPEQRHVQIDSENVALADAAKRASESIQKRLDALRKGDRKTPAQASLLAMQARLRAFTESGKWPSHLRKFANKAIMDWYRAGKKAELNPVDTVDFNGKPFQYPQDVLSSEAMEGAVDKSRLFGQYLPEYNLAIFYANAEPGTVLHEWFHHLMSRDLLPASMFEALVARFAGGKSLDKMTRFEMMIFKENCANAFTAYIHEGYLPEGADENLTNAFKFIRGTFSALYAKSRQAINIGNDAAFMDMKLNNALEIEFEKLFGGVEADATEAAAATVVQESIESSETASGKQISLAQLIDQVENGNDPAEVQHASEEGEEVLNSAMANDAGRKLHVELMQYVQKLFDNAYGNRKDRLMEAMSHVHLFAAPDIANYREMLQIYDRVKGANGSKTLPAVARIMAGILDTTDGNGDLFLRTVGMGRVAEAPMNSDAYHGGQTWQAEDGFPHGRPNLSYIGTGEGSLAFGWGWYGAENAAVAETYRAVSPTKKWKGINLSDSSLKDIIPIDALDALLDPDNMHVTPARIQLVHQKHDLEFHSKNQYSMNITSEDRKRYSVSAERIQRAIDWIDAHESELEMSPRDGSLYKLDVPDGIVEKLLPWDSAVPVDMLNKLRSQNISENNGPLGFVSKSRDFTGESLYHTAESRLPSAREASEFFLRAGISGQRYLDGFSRNRILESANGFEVVDREGALIGAYKTRQEAEKSASLTYNYVIWDQNVLDKIAMLERNGEKMDAMRKEAEAPMSSEAEPSGEKKKLTPSMARLGRAMFGAFKQQGDSGKETLARIKEASLLILGREYRPTAMTEIEMRKLLDAKFRLIPNLDNSSVVGAYLKSFFGVRSLSQLNNEDRDLAEDLLRIIATSNKKMTIPKADQKTVDKILNFLKVSPDQIKASRAAGGTGWLSRAKRFMEGARTFKTYLAPFSYLTKYLDGCLEDGIFDKVFGKRQRAGIVESGRLNREDGQKIEEMLKVAGVTHKEKNKGIMLGKAQTMFPADTVAYLAAACKGSTESALTTQASSLREANSELTIDVLMDALKVYANDKHVRAMADAMHKYLEGKYNELNPVFRDMTGHDLPKVPFYVSIVRESQVFHEGDAAALIDKAPDKLTMRDGRPNILPQADARTNRGGRIEILDPFRTVVARDMRTANNYIAKAKYFGEMISIIDNTQVREAISHKHGAGTYGHFRDSILGEMYSMGRTTPLKPSELVLQRIRSVAQATPLGFKLKTMLQTTLSALPIFSLIPGGFTNVPSAIGHAMSIAGAMSRNMAWLLTHGQSEVASTFHILQGCKEYDILNKWAPHVLARHGNAVMINDILAGRRRGLGNNITIKGKSIAEHSVALLADMDMWSIAAGWMAAFEAAQGAYEKTMNRAEAEREAADYANKVISKTQSTPNPHEKSLFQRESEWNNQITVFTSFFFNMFNHYQYDVLMPIVNAVKTGRLGSTMFGGDGKLVPGTLQQIAFSVVIPAMLTGIFRRLRMPTEDEWWRDLLAYPFASVPVFGNVVSQAIMTQSGGGFMFNISPYSSQPFTAGIKALANAGQGKWERVGQPAALSLAMFTGMPDVFAQLARVLVEDGVKTGWQGGWTPELHKEVFKALAINRTDIPKKSLSK